MAIYLIIIMNNDYDNYCNYYYNSVQHDLDEEAITR